MSLITHVEDRDAVLMAYGVYNLISFQIRTTDNNTYPITNHHKASQGCSLTYD